MELNGFWYNTATQELQAYSHGDLLGSLSADAASNQATRAHWELDVVHVLASRKPQDLVAFVMGYRLSKTGLPPTIPVNA